MKEIQEAFWLAVQEFDPPDSDKAAFSDLRRPVGDPGAIAWVTVGMTWIRDRSRGCCAGGGRYFPATNTPGRAFRVFPGTPNYRDAPGCDMGRRNEAAGILRGGQKRRFGGYLAGNTPNFGASGSTGRGVGWICAAVRVRRPDNWSSGGRAPCSRHRHGSAFAAAMRNDHNGKDVRGAGPRHTHQDAETRSPTPG